MHELDFNHPGGFPLNTSTLQTMQEAWNSFGLIVKGFGDNVILSGCEIQQLSGQHFNITDGVIVIDSNVMLFQGGQFVGTDMRIEIIEEKDTVVLKNGDTVVFKTTRMARLSSTAAIKLSDFTRVKNSLELNTMLATKADKQELAQLQALIPFLEIRVTANGSIMYRNGKFNGQITVQRAQYEGNVVPGVYHVYLEGFDKPADFNNMSISVFQMQKGIASQYVSTSYINITTSDDTMTGDSSFILTIK